MDYNVLCTIEKAGKGGPRGEKEDPWIDESARRRWMGSELIEIVIAGSLGGNIVRIVSYCMLLFFVLKLIPLRWYC